MEHKTYKFSNGVEAYQEELTLEQDYKLAELITGFNISGLDELNKLQIKDILNLLVKENVVERFLEIVLMTPSPAGSPPYHPKGCEAQRGDGRRPEGVCKTLKNSEVKQVIEDFFTLNPLLNGLSQILKTVPDTQMTSPTLSSSETSAENLTQVS